METKKKSEKIINIVVIAITIIVSFFLGAIFKDYVYGPITLTFGFLNAYYMAKGRWENYVYGILFTLTYAYICTINGLYGWIIFSFVVYIPVQIYGLVNWFKHKTNEEVEMKSFNLENSILICSSILVGSVFLGYLLSLIPTQNLAFLDSTSQIINICGVVLVALRFRECWYIWLANNTIDLSIWIINTVKGTTFSEMTLIISIMYLVMNIIGLISWIKIERKQKENICTQG